MAGANRNWIRWVSLGLIPILAGTVVILLQRPPAYEGKTARAWLRELTRPNQNSREQARQAFARMDQGALPTLRHALQKEDSWLDRQLGVVAMLLPFVDFDFVGAPAWRSAAVEAAAMMGTNALPLLPDLIGTFNDPNHRNVNANFESAFASFGLAAIPPLAEAMQSVAGRPANPYDYLALNAWRKIIRRDGLPDDLLPTVQQTVLNKLKASWPDTAIAAARLAGDLGAKAEPSIPALLDLCRHVNASARQTSVNALGMIGQSPANVVPTLESRLADNDSQVRQEALKALANFKTNAIPAVPAMARLVRDPSRSVALTALNSLASLGPWAASSAPEIITALNNADVSLRARAAAVLIKVTRDPFQVVPALTQALRSEDLDIRVNAAQSLGQLGSNAAPALQPLIAALSDSREPVQISVVEALGNIGPPARPAIPDLYLAWNNNQSALGPSVKAALKKIDPQAQK